MLTLFFSFFCWAIYMLTWAFFGTCMGVCVKKSSYTKYVTLGTMLASVLLGYLIISGDTSGSDDELVGIIIKAFAVGIGCFLVRILICKLVEAFQRKRLIAQKSEMERQAEDRRLETLQQKTWQFPCIEFYDLCRETNVPEPDGTSFSKLKLEKAVAYILNKHKIPEAFWQDYVSRGEEFYAKARKEIRQKEHEKALYESTPVSFTPSEEEKNVLSGIYYVKTLSGTEKRSYMLENEIKYLAAKSSALSESILLPGQIHKFPLQKEKSWATWGGIAQGLAGPAAGLATALQVQKDNERIRQTNTTNLMLNIKLEEAREWHNKEVLAQIQKVDDRKAALKKQCEQLALKVVFPAPESVALASCITLEELETKKTESGILEISLSIKCSIPTKQRPIPNVVLDGVLHTKLYTEKQFVGDVHFVLPCEGVVPNGESISLQSLCTNALPVDGNYSVTLGNESNLWLMEA